MTVHITAAIEKNISKQEMQTNFQLCNFTPEFQETKQKQSYTLSLTAWEFQNNASPYSNIMTKLQQMIMIGFLICYSVEMKWVLGSDPGIRVFAS